MDVAALSTAMSQARLITDVGTTMLAKSLESMETGSEELAKMMEKSVNPEIGANIDLSV